MKIDNKVIQTAASSQLGRLELRSTNGNQTCVCNKSFSGWVVHVLRYKFSKNYREQEQETRRQILTATLGNGNEEFNLSDEQRNSLLDRRRFNRYIHAETEASTQPTDHKESNATLPDASVQKTQSDETLAQTMSETPLPDEEPSVTPPDASVQNTQAEKTPQPTENEVPASGQESNVIPSDTSAQNTQAEKTHQPTENEIPAPSQEPGTTSAKESGEEEQPETRERTQTSSLTKPTADSSAKTVEKRTGNEAAHSKAVPGKISNNAEEKLQPSSERKLSQSGTEGAGSAEKEKPNESLSKDTLKQPKVTNPQPATTKTAAKARPVTTEGIMVPYRDTVSESDNPTWVGKRNRWAAKHFNGDHAATVFYVGDGKNSIAHEFKIAFEGGNCPSTVATLEKRIGERLKQCDSKAGANTKHFLTYLTLRSDQVPEERDRLFEIEDMNKSSHSATWSEDFMNGGLWGVPPNAKTCGRRLPTGTLMFAANKIISKLPVEKRTGVIKDAAGRRSLNNMRSKAADPAYRKEFSPDVQELGQEDFEWLLEKATSFVSYCNQTGD